MAQLPVHTRKVGTDMKRLLSHAIRRSFGMGMTIMAVAVFPVQAAANTPCTTPTYYQPFLYAGDENYYALPGGESYDDFEGTGWQLSGGAKVLTTTLYDGTTGQVLDLPSGSKAVSPVLCVTSEYPTARAVVRNVKGSEGVFFYVEYEGTNTWGNPRNTGQIHGNNSEWSLVTPVNLQPENSSGWQPMRITLVPGGKTSEFQVYNLYADPRMR
jgi:hypothetical protein